MALRIFTGERDNTPETLEQYATDASVFRVRPSEVLYPKTVKDIIAVVQTLREEKKDNPNLTLSIRAGGTCMSGGSLNSGWVLDMTRHMNTVSIDPKNQTATVEMGAYFRDIEKAAAEHGLMFAPYPSSHLICGIGGMLGNNASGEKSVRYGATIDNVLSLEVVLADGSVIITQSQSVESITNTRDKALLGLHTSYAKKLTQAIGRVSKTASGYRLERLVQNNQFNATPLFIGAQGTLGIITKATLKLVPIPKYTRLVIISIDSLTDMPFILQTVMRYNPEGVETFDRNTFAKAEVHMAEDAAIIKKYWNTGTSLIILAQFSEATGEETDAQAEKCIDALEKKQIHAQYIADSLIVDAAWRIRRSSFLLIRDYNALGYKAVPCVEDIIVPVDQFAVFIPALIALIKKHDIQYGFHGHIGDGALRIIPIFDFSDEQVAQKIIAFTRDVFILVKRLGGNMSADHSDGIIRSPFLKEFYGDELYTVFVKIKNIFDPERLFNAHKKTESSEKYIEKYLDR